MATIYENYTAPLNDFIRVRSSLLWGAQTFQASSSHNVTNIKLSVFRTGSPGTATVELRATSAGLPTGSALTSGTFDGNSLTTSSSGQIVDVSVTPYTLVSGTTYAVVLSAPSGSGGNEVDWMDNTTGGTTGNGLCTSVDSGASWSDAQPTIQYFEIYGDALASGTKARKTLLGVGK